MHYKHIMIELYCKKDKGECDLFPEGVNHNCIVKKCKNILLTPCPNEIAYADENGIVSSWIGFGGDMDFSCDDESRNKLIYRWKEICESKMNSALEQYLSENDLNTEAFRKSMNEWDIFPDEGVGEFKILDPFEKVYAYLINNNIEFNIEKNIRSGISLNTGDMRISFDKEKLIFAISVFRNFKGKINNTIGIGSTLKDVEIHLGKYIDGMNIHCPTYELANIKGVEFKLSNDVIYDDIIYNYTAEWDESAIPIAQITVWNSRTWDSQVSKG